MALYCGRVITTDERGIRNVMVQAWRPLPTGILDEPKVQFDITRRADAQEKSVPFVGQPKTTVLARYPDLLDQPNDDLTNTNDEAGPYGEYLFVEDPPGIPRTVVFGLSKTAIRFNFEEYVRVSINNPKPVGNNPSFTTSRSSLKFDWHSQIYVIANNGVYERAPTYNNIGPQSDSSNFPF